MLQTRPYKNLLSIALLELDPDRASLYFSQHLIEDRENSPEEEEEPPVEP